MSRPYSDRNLLIGIMALQNDFISRDALLVALGEWVADKSKSLGDILIARGDLAQHEYLRLDALIQTHLAHHAGDIEKSLAAIDLISTVRQELQRLEDPDLDASLMHIAPPTIADSNAGQEPSANVPSLSGSRFTILRLHDEGGLGRVSVALDQELKREVALKEIKGHFAHHADSRARFLLEAEITGKLEHPGIVPVYGLGAYSDGRPYYAMRFIKGDSLKNAISGFHRADKRGRDPGERSLALRQLLGRFVDVCNAVGYAHSRGVLHRDLKPGNVMLGKYGETLVVDWGLAKATGHVDNQGENSERPVEPSTSSGSTPTMHGKALGTPAFMSPEQAAGHLDRLGPASDVFSLGATLYQLLTGKLAHESDNVGELLAKVQRGDFLAPRHANSNVPAALEAICLKAMAREPADRFATAKALADDVEHWLADEPVSAYRDPVLARALRWSRRHRAWVATAASLLVAGLIVSTVGSILLRQKNVEIEGKRIEAELARGREANERAKAEQERSIAERERDRAENNFKLAQDAVEKTLTGVAENQRLTESDFHDLRLSLLQTAVPFYEEFVKQKGDQPEQEAKRGHAYSRYAFLLNEMGKQQAAKENYQHMGEVFASLSKKFPTKAEYRQDLAKSHYSLANQLRQFGQVAEGEKSLAAALALQVKLVEENPREPDFRKDLSLSHYSLGNLQTDLGRRAEAERSFGTASDIQKKLAEEFSDNESYRRMLAASQHNLGNLQHEFGRLALAELSHENALSVRKTIAEKYPKIPTYQQELALSNLSLGALQRKLGKLPQAQQSYAAAVAIQMALAEAYPKVPGYRADVGMSQNGLGIVQLKLDKKTDALKSFSDSLSIRKLLADKNPSVPSLRQDVAESLENVGNAQSSLGNDAEAERSFVAALEIHKEFAKKNPNLPSQRQDVAVALYNLGNVQCRLQKVTQAERSYAGALVIQESLAKENPRVLAYQQELAQSHYNFGLLQYGLWKRVEAEKSFTAAVAIRKGVTEADPKLPEYRQELGAALKNLATVQFDLGKTAQAEQSSAAAVAIYQVLLEQNPNLPSYRKELASSCLNLGLVLHSEGQLQKAIDFFSLGAKHGSARATSLLALCEREQSLVKRLPAILAGKEKPVDACEYAEFASLCNVGWQRRTNAAASFYSQAFALDPKLADDLRNQHRYTAACAAALAGCGQGIDVEKLGATEKSKLRSDALTWLKADFSAWAKQLKSARPADQQLARMSLQHWLQDSALAGVRGAAIDKLPEAERAGWRDLWREVQSTLKKPAGS